MSEKTIADVLDKSIDKLSGGAAEIAKAAKQMAPHAWEVVVRQQVVEGALSLLIWCAVVACAALLIRWGRFLCRRDGSGTEGDVGVAVFISAGVVVLVAAIAAVAGGSDTISQIINPEYYAAKAILEAVK